MTTIEGACHCRNVTFTITTSREPDSIEARACACDFCRRHAAACFSDPDGHASIRIADESRLVRYRFAQRTADFLICGHCGAYVGALLDDSHSAWSTLNLHLTPCAGVAVHPVSYAGESAAGRRERRRQHWTPTRVSVSCPAR